MTELEKLRERIETGYMGANKIQNVYPLPSEWPPSEQWCGEVNDFLDALANGEFKDLKFEDSPELKEDV